MATKPSSPSSRGPVEPTVSASVALRPARAATITGGFWFDRQQANRRAGLPDGRRQLHVAGNEENLDTAALGLPPLRAGERIDPGASGLDADSTGYRGPVFMDSDVYKWLEAAAWERQREVSDELAADQERLTGQISAAQQTDGYLNSFVQIVTGAPWADLRVSHELYCAGHLIQAAVAAHRSSADAELLRVSGRFADLLADTFGPGRSPEVDGHPIIEMALVELYRETGTTRYLDLARFAVEQRGRSEQHGRPEDFVYFSDRVPVREATTLEGHAVRALYLAAGATDVAIETGDPDLLAALETQWENVVEAKMYLTGGLGARWEGESFGDPFELPPDTAYAETCAAIASVQWSWRLLLATGRARYADLIERTLFNGMLAGVSLDGESFFYANVLASRGGTEPTSSIDPVRGRQRWFSTACCPPNVMRTLAQLQHYLATQSASGLQVHQYAPGSVAAELATGFLALEVTTDYPHHGEVRLTLTAVPTGRATVSLRVPAWAVGATASVNGEALLVLPGSYLEIDRAWAVGDSILLELPLTVRLTAPDPRIVSVRGTVAIERGPLVYCLEEADQPAGAEFGALRVDIGAAADAHAERAEILGGTVVVTVPGQLDGAAVTLRAIPYALWANREHGSMRVWIPTA